MTSETLLPSSALGRHSLTSGTNVQPGSWLQMPLAPACAHRAGAKRGQGVGCLQTAAKAWILEGRQPLWCVRCVLQQKQTRPDACTRRAGLKVRRRRSCIPATEGTPAGTPPASVADLQALSCAASVPGQVNAIRPWSPVTELPAPSQLTSCMFACGCARGGGVQLAGAKRSSATRGQHTWPAVVAQQLDRSQGCYCCCSCCLAHVHAQHTSYASSPTQLLFQ